MSIELQKHAWKTKIYGSCVQPYTVNHLNSIKNGGYFWSLILKTRYIFLEKIKLVIFIDVPLFVIECIELCCLIPNKSKKNGQLEEHLRRWPRLELVKLRRCLSIGPQWPFIGLCVSVREPGKGWVQTAAFLFTEVPKHEDEVPTEITSSVNMLDTHPSKERKKANYRQVPSTKEELGESRPESQCAANCRAES